MRELGLPKVLMWRWTPCAAFVLGSLSFVGFALLTIPDRIGHVVSESTTDFHLASQLGRAQAPAPAPATPDWSSSSDTTNTAAPPSPAESRPTRTTDVSAFPRRGFSPPLERPEPPAPPPPPPPAAAPPPPAPPQLNVPPPGAPPAAPGQLIEVAPTAPPAQQIEAAPQAAPTPPDAPANGLHDTD